MTLKLHTIICSTRPSRVGPSIANWFHEVATEDSAFDAELVDLASFNLPIFNEPHHPRLQTYEYEHTKAWAASVAAADAFVFVMPEYNFSPPASFVNALNYLVLEWTRKPAAFVSYAGVSGGLRAVQAAKLMLTGLKVMPITEQVVIPMFFKQLTPEKVFQPNELQTESAVAMLAELARWAQALKTMREGG